MGIRKADLYKFVENKVNSLRLPIWKTIEEGLKLEFYPVIAAKYPEADGLERLAQRFYDELQSFYGKHKVFANYNFQETARRVNAHVIGTRTGIAADQAGYGTWNILKNATNGLMPELEELLPAAKAKYLVEITQYKELGKLAEELLPIIDGCRTGDKAYAKLQELGVDLTGFDTGTPNLPAVIKLSVNVCLLNGDCP